MLLPGGRGSCRAGVALGYTQLSRLACLAFFRDLSLYVSSASFTEGLGIREEEAVPVIAGHDDGRVVPCLFFFDPFGDRLEGFVSAEYRANRVVDVDVMTGPVNVARFDHHPKTVGIH